MDKKTFTKMAFKVHGYLGLVFGLFYLFFGISGSVLIFSKDVEHRLHTELHHVLPQKKKASVDSIFRSLAVSYPPVRQIVLNHFPATSHDSYEFMIFEYQQKTTDNYLSYAFVNPYTGQVLKKGNFGDIKAPFSRWLYSAHYCLQADKPGRLITAIIGLFFIVNLTTGVWIYRKHVAEVLRFKAGLSFKNRRTFFSSLHRVVGVWSLVLNFLMFFSGFWMNKSLFMPSEWEIIPAQKENYLIGGDIDIILQKAQQIKGFTPIAIKVGTDQKKDVVVNGRFEDTVNPLLWGKASDVYFDSDTGELKEIIRIEDKSIADQFYWAMKQFHMGHYDNLFVKIIYALVGLSPAILSLTGYLLWRKRKKPLKKKYPAMALNTTVLP
jgi:LPXTG-motif cell wall-anchored protein